MNQQEVKLEEKIIPEQNTTLIEQKNNPVELQENDKEINWRKFREQREIERKQKIEAERIAAEERAKAEALKAAMDALLNKSNHSNQNNNQYSENEETEEERIDKKVKAAIAREKESYERERIQQEQASFPQRLNSTFQDFNQVCNTENLDYLEYHYPEVATPYKHMADGFDKWAAIYKAVKRFVPNTDSKKEQKKAEANFIKPQSISSTGTTQGGNAMPAARLDESRKAENWARMQKALKGLS